MTELNQNSIWPDDVLRTLGEWKEPSDESIAAALGKDTLEFFHYSFYMLGRKKRKDCDHLAIAHSYDVALRVKNFMEQYGFPEEHIKKAVRMALFHDILEDSCSSLDDLIYMNIDLYHRFGEDVADDILLMTDPYPVMINELSGNSLSGIETEKIVDFEKILQESGDNINRITEKIRQLNLDDLLNKNYTESLMTSLEAINDLRLKNSGYVTRDDFKDVKLRLYGLYTGNIISASYKLLGDGNPSFLVPLIVKAMDGIDNARTIPVSKEYEADMAIRKTEIKIDMFEDFSKVLESEGRSSTPFNNLITEMKKQLIAMTLTNFMSNQYKLDTRYSISEDYFVESISRLVRKYDNPQKDLYTVGYFELVKPLLAARYGKHYPEEHWDNEFRYATSYIFDPETHNNPKGER